MGSLSGGLCTGSQLLCGGSWVTPAIAKAEELGEWEDGSSTV